MRLSRRAYPRRSLGTVYQSPTQRLLKGLAVGLLVVAASCYGYYGYYAGTGDGPGPGPGPGPSPTAPSPSLSPPSILKSTLLESPSPPPSPPSSSSIAVIIPFVGPTLPPYFSLFLQTALLQAPLLHFLIFYTDETSHVINHIPSSPSNVQFINLGPLTGPSLFATLHARVVTHTETNSPSGKLTPQETVELTTLLTDQFRHHPYTLVEYKPAYGHIFSDYIKDHTHWGYADLDQIFGDSSKWITPDELTDYDVVTYSHGDQDKAYLRGQFTFHKNTATNRQLWRPCECLSELHTRYRLSPHATPPPKWRLESAEGCYSWAVITNKTVKVKYAVKGMADVKKSDSVTEGGIFLEVRNGGGGAFITAHPFCTPEVFGRLFPPHPFCSSFFSSSLLLSSSPSEPPPESPSGNPVPHPPPPPTSSP